MRLLRLIKPLMLGAGMIVAAVSLFTFSSTSAKAACVQNVSVGDVLWFRSGPGSRFARIGSFGRRECGIRIFWNSCSGSWCRVKKGGRQGWSHTRYLGNNSGGGGGGGLCARSCQRLWVSRNTLYKNNGYCFKSQRARNYFGNAGCWTSNPKFTNWERRRVRQIRRCERNKGC